VRKTLIRMEVDLRMKRNRIPAGRRRELTAVLNQIFSSCLVLIKLFVGALLQGGRRISKERKRCVVGGGYFNCGEFDKILNCVACMQSRRNGTDTLELVFIAPVTQGNWVGLGFSSTGKMAGSVALIALMNASSTSPTPYWWRLDDHSIPPSSDAQYSSFSSNLNQSQYIDGTVYISVVVNITAILAPSTPDSFLFAYGLASGSTPQQHTQETSQVANFAPAGKYFIHQHLWSSNSFDCNLGFGLSIFRAPTIKYCRCMCRSK